MGTRVYSDEMRTRSSVCSNLHNSRSLSVCSVPGPETQAVAIHSCSHACEPWGCQVWWGTEGSKHIPTWGSGSDNSAVMPWEGPCRPGHQQRLQEHRPGRQQKKWRWGRAWKAEQSSPGRGGRREFQASEAAPAKTQTVNGQFTEQVGDSRC